VLSAAALAGAALFILAGLAWTARLVHIGNLDALSLVAKTAVPDPLSPVDWPELRIRSVVTPPDDPLVVLLFVEWPARQRTATLLLALDSGDRRSRQLLAEWSADQVAVAPSWRDGSRIELRRRQSLARVRGLLMAEQPVPQD
jgi:hypothetical protein